MENYKALEEMIFSRAVDDYVKTKCIRNTYLYRDYISGKLNREIEDRYGLCMGSIRHAAEHIGWVMLSFGDIARAMGYNEQVVEKFRKLAEQLQYGVPKSGLELARLRVPGLGRERINMLVRQGLEDADSLKELSLPELSRWVTNPVAKRLNAKLDAVQSMSNVSSIELPVIPPVSADKLELIGGQENRRFSIKLNEKFIGLNEKSFEALLKLAIARLEEPEGWIDKNELGFSEGGITQGISRLRDSLQLFQVSPDDSIIENDNKGHYRLKLSEDQISINWDNVRQLPSSPNLTI